MIIRDEDLKETTINGLVQKVNEDANKALDSLIAQHGAEIAPAIVFGAIGAITSIGGLGAKVGFGVADLFKSESKLGAPRKRELKFHALCKKWCIVKMTVGIQNFEVIIGPDFDVDVLVNVFMYNEGDRISETQVKYLEIGSDEQLLEFIKNYSTDAAGTLGTIETSYQAKENAHVYINNTDELPLVLVNQDKTDIYSY